MFYKLEDGLLSAGGYISGVDELGNGYDLNQLDHEAGLYTYPVHGWYWFATEDEAKIFFGLI